jgi:hypothetical protein
MAGTVPASDNYYKILINKENKYFAELRQRSAPLSQRWLTTAAVCIHRFAGSTIICTAAGGKPQTGFGVVHHDILPDHKKYHKN